jgi:hypothetical protein
MDAAPVYNGLATLLPVVEVEETSWVAVTSVGADEGLAGAEDAVKTSVEWPFPFIELSSSWCWASLAPATEEIDAPVGSEELTGTIVRVTSFSATVAAAGGISVCSKVLVMVSV